MTSSLVGSEMCIRDREESAQDQDHACPRRGTAQLHAHWGGTTGREGQPVSYTHLTLPTICSV
eukprot:1913502-Prorocentrum_lima.AAC.1